MQKLAKLFKSSSSSVVLVYYCGAADERGNWLMGSSARSASGVVGDAHASGSQEAWGPIGSPSAALQISASGVLASGNSPRDSPAGTSSGRVGGTTGHTHTQVVSFREVSSLWQQHRRHSQRLVLLLDCPGSGIW